MPTYDYQCKNCNHKFEAFQSMSAEPLTDCPECKGTVKRLISGGTGLIFKGSGFYITDYKNKKPDSTSPKKDSDTTKKKTTETKPKEKKTTTK